MQPLARRSRNFDSTLCRTNDNDGNTEASRAYEATKQIVSAILEAIQRQHRTISREQKPIGRYNMNVKEALKARHSTRSFSDKAIPAELLQSILDQAALSPSWSNTHPYRIAIAQGDVIEDLREVLYSRYLRSAKVQRMSKVGQVKALLTRDPGIPDGDVKPILNYPKDLQQRRFECGMGLYETLGIGRKDYAAREKQMAENFRFFGAPVAVFLFIHKDVGLYSALDAGIFMQSLMLAATAEGLGSCAQGALGLYRKPVEKHFKIPVNYHLLCGVALGYEDEAPVNKFQPEKMTSKDLEIPKR